VSYSSIAGPDSFKNHHYVCFCQSSIPLLFVCREARSVGLYELEDIPNHASSIEEKKYRGLNSEMHNLELDARVNWYNRSSKRTKSIPYHKYSYKVSGRMMLKAKFNTETDIFWIHEKSWTATQAPFPLQLFDSHFTQEVLPKIKYLPIAAGADEYIIRLLREMKKSKLKVIFIMQHPHGLYNNDNTKVHLSPVARQRFRMEEDLIGEVSRFGRYRVLRGWSQPKVKIVYSRIFLETILRRQHKI
jgi:hypothetical protein